MINSMCIGGQLLFDVKLEENGTVKNVITCKRDGINPKTGTHDFDRIQIRISKKNAQWFVSRFKRLDYVTVQGHMRSTKDNTVYIEVTNIQ